MKHRILWIAMLLSSLFVAFSCDKSDPKKTETPQAINYLDGKTFIGGEDVPTSSDDNRYAYEEISFKGLIAIVTYYIKDEDGSSRTIVREVPYSYKEGVLTINMIKSKVISSIDIDEKGVKTDRTEDERKVEQDDKDEFLQVDEVKHTITVKEEDGVRVFKLK